MPLTYHSPPLAWRYLLKLQLQSTLYTQTMGLKHLADVDRQQDYTGPPQYPSSLEPLGGLGTSKPRLLWVFLFPIQPTDSTQGSSIHGLHAATPPKCPLSVGCF